MPDSPVPYASAIGRELAGFFASLNESQRDDPRQVALSYAERFTDRDRLRELRPPVGHAGVYNMAISSTAADLTMLTKRVSLISDTLLLAHFRQGSMYNCRSETIPDPAGATYLGRSGTEYYLRCPDPAALGRWLLACEPLLLRGALAYHPDLVAETKVQGEYWGAGIPVAVDERREELSERTFAPLIDIIADGRKIIEVPAEDPLKTLKAGLVHPILQVELPFLEGDELSLADFCAITAQETNAFEAFRDQLRKRFLELDHAAGSEQFDRDMLRIGIDIRQAVREYEEALTRIRKIRAVTVTGAIVATIPAVLVAVTWEQLLPVLAALGIDGGLKLLYDTKLKVIEARPTPANFPYLYLWLLQNPKKAVPYAGMITARDRSRDKDELNPPR